MASLPSACQCSQRRLLCFPTGLITRSNGIPPLIELLSKGNLATQAAAARTLWHLAGNSTAGEAIAAAGGMQPLCSMLSSEDVHAQVC
jgi:hypothetical protein